MDNNSTHGGGQGTGLGVGYSPTPSSPLPLPLLVTASTAAPGVTRVKLEVRSRKRRYDTQKFFSIYSRLHYLIFLFLSFPMLSLTHHCSHHPSPLATPLIDVQVHDWQLNGDAPSAKSIEDAVNWATQR